MKIEFSNYYKQTDWITLFHKERFLNRGCQNTENHE